jgi:hypothetical protein
MFSFIKRLFQRKEALPRVEVTGFRGGLVGLRSEANLTFSEQVVETTTPAGLCKTRLRVQSYDPGNKVYLAQVDENDPTLESLDIDLSNLSRVSKTLRVSSRDLPLYTALTEEVSLSGLRISTQGPLCVDRLLNLSVEFDCPKLETQKFNTVVEWSAEKSDGTWHSWLRFQEVDSLTFRRVAQYISSVRQRTQNAV